MNTKSLLASFRTKSLPGTARLTQLAIAAMAAAAFSAPSSALATLYSWNTGDGTWQTGANWSSAGTTGAVPTSTDTALFNQSGVNGNEAVQLNANASISGITFANTGTTLLESDSSTARTLQLNGNNGLTINSGAGAVTIGDATNVLNLTFNASSLNNINNSSSMLTIANGITSSAASGTQDLRFNAGNATVTGVIGNGATGGTVSVRKNGSSSTLTLSGANTYTGVTTLQLGTIQANAADVAGVSGALGNGGNITFAGGTLQYTSISAGADYSSRIKNSASAITVDTNSQNVSFASTIDSSNTGGVTVLGSAGSLTLSGSNTYAGTTTVNNGGTLNINNSAAISTGALSLASTATIDNTSGSALTLGTNNAVTFTGFIFGGSNNLNLGSGAVSYNNNSGTVTLNGTNKVLTFSGTATNINSSATGITLTVNGAGNTLSLGGYNINAATKQHQFTINGSGNVTITGPVADGSASAGTLTYSGAGILTLSGSNSYTGNTTLSGGQLNVGNAYALSSGTLILGTGAAVGLDNVAGSTLNLATNNPITANSSTLNFVGTNSLVLGTGTLTITNSATINVNANTLTMPGAITGAFGFTKGGAGLLVLSGANTNSTFTANAGTLQFAKEVSLLNNVTTNWTAANIKAASGATLAFNVGGSNEFTTSDVTTLLTNLDGTVSSNGLKAGSFIGFDTTNATGAFTISNAIKDTTGTGGGAVGLTKLGAGALALSGPNTYTGATTVNAGTLTVDGSLAAGSAVTVNSGAILNGGGTINGTVVISGALSGSLTLANNATINSGATAAASAFNGNIITNGAITSAVSLQNGKMLSGLGSVSGGLTATAGSTVSPSANNTSTVGNLTMSSFNENASAHLALQINGTTAGDTITTTADSGLSLAGDATFTFASNYVPTVSDVLSLILNNGAGAISGAFSGITIVDNSGSHAYAGLEGTQVTINGQVFQLTYATTLDSSSSNDVALLAVPEPSTWAMMLGGTGMLFLFQRRRRPAM